MERYSDDLYKNTLTALIGDIYYADGISIDAKIARIRKLAEVIVRRLIKYNPRSALTLGDYRTRDALDNCGMNEPFFRDALKTINKYGNDSIHSRNTELPTAAVFEEVSAALTNLYAYLFFDYFKRRGFDIDNQIKSAFSTLPPYLRFTVLRELCYSGFSNAAVLEKLARAAVKSFGFKGALDWIEENRCELETLDICLDETDAYGSDAEAMILECEGTLYFVQPPRDACGSVYDYLAREIASLEILSHVPAVCQYRTFEEAREFYLRFGIVEGDTAEVREFNEIMRFVFQGRKSEETAEFERSVENLENSLRSFSAYYDAMSTDHEIGRDIIQSLESARNEIDGILNGLLGEVGDD